MLIKDGRPTSYFKAQSYLFGKTRRQQLCCLESESRAYYDLIRPAAVKKMTYMCPEFEIDTHKHTNTWLQTINLV